MGTRRADRILDELEQMIATGAFADGERLDEIKLAEHFGVSRTPVREALLSLSTSGLVEQRPRRGVFVRQPGPLELIDLFECMAELEASCARLAASRISTPMLDTLRATNARCQEALTAQDADRYYDENERFHRIIYDASGNEPLADMALKLQKRLRPFRRMQLHLRGRMSQSMNEHEKIVACLESGDAETVASTMRDHVAVQGEKFHHLLSSLKAAE